MKPPISNLWDKATRLEAMLTRGGWPVRLARALGIKPSVRTTRHAVSIHHGSDGMPPLKIAYASDFHAGPATDSTVLRAACAELRAAAPDVLLLGGDFVTLVPTEIDWLAAELGNIPAPWGRFAVLGNHDWWSDTPYLVQKLEGAGIQVLTNRNVQLGPPFESVWICGIDDHWCGNPDAGATMSGAADIRILLMHSPSGLLDLDGERFHLALCGHTHGGQVALPGGIPIVVPHGRLSRRYSRGRFELAEDQTLIVSVGLGCVLVPFRLFAQPEIVLCEVSVGGHPRAGTGKS
ncbi:MAG TPA: metallophosphoesterase [Anaerolineales bacterium]|nr:metallophosphoesterase [Anaerolineales bacterium]